MVQDVNSIKKIPKNVDESLKFYTSFLKKYFENKFTTTKVYNFKNELIIPKLNDFLKMYQATTYYDETIIDDLKKLIQLKINRYGTYKVKKNAKLLIAKKV